MELGDVEIDYCTECEGIWLDKGELQLLLGNGDKAKMLINSFKKAPESRMQRKCPICDKMMEQVSAGKTEPALLIDRCVKGDGLWFDRGELNDIIERADLGEGNKIKKLLGDMFGAKENKSKK